MTTDRYIPSGERVEGPWSDVGRNPNALASADALFGLVGDGSADDTGALARAAASGQSLRFRAGASYRITAPIDLQTRTRFYGDGSQTITQQTPLAGALRLIGDNCAVAGMQLAYAPSRAVAIASISKGNPAVITTQTPHGRTTLDRVRIMGIGTGSMTQMNKRSCYVRVTSPTTYECYNNIAYPGSLSGAVDSTGFMTYDATKDRGVTGYSNPGTNSYGLSGFQQICGVWLQGSRAVVRDVSASNFYVGATLRGPVNTWSKPIAGITKANPGVLYSPGHGLIDASPLSIPNAGGMTQLNGFGGSAIYIDADHISLSSGGLPVDTSSFDAYVSGGNMSGYDWRTNSTGLQIKNLDCDQCDFAITAGCYTDIIIDRPRLTNGTSLTVPPHVMYLQNADPTGSFYEGFCQNIVLRNLDASDYLFTEAFKLSNTRDLRIEAPRLRNCLGGITVSRSFNSVIVAPDIQDVPDAQYGIRYTDNGSDHSIIGGTIGGAANATFYAVLADDNNQRVVADTVKVLTNFTTASSGALQQFKTGSTASMRCIDPVVDHLQANTGYAFGNSGTSRIEVINPSMRGNTRLLKNAAGCTAVLQVDANMVDSWNPNSTASLSNSGTLIKTEIPGKTVYANLPAPVLFGTSVAGSNTYGDGSTVLWAERDGEVVQCGLCVRLAALDGTMAGDLYGQTLPATVARGSGSVAVNPVFQCDRAEGLTGLPSTSPFHYGVYAELIAGTLTFRFFYLTTGATGQTRNYVTPAMLTNTSLLTFTATYLTSDP